jgi:hypothetical protein
MAGKKGGSGAIVKAQAAQLAEDNAALHRKNAHLRQMAKSAKEAGKEALTASKKKLAEMAKTTLDTAGQQPIVDNLAEMTGTVAEAYLFKKKPEYENYAVAASFVGEVACIAMAMQPKTSRDERDVFRIAASGWRGVRARFNVKMADKLVAAVT